MDNNYFENYINNILSIAQIIDKRKKEIINLLSDYESYETANDEINRSIDTLNGFLTELKDKHISQPKYSSISTFFPINLPLYSLILFAITPGIFSKKVYIRPPLAINNLLNELFDIIDLKKHLNHIEICKVSRKDFLNDFVSFSEVVIFNGRYENVHELIIQFPKKIFIYNGRGINPCIIGSDANLEIAVKKTIEMRIYNSGQDCAGVDAIFVKNNIYSDFINLMNKEINKIKIGNYKIPSVQIGKIQRKEYIKELKDNLIKEKIYITLQGTIDEKNQIITPYIIEKNINDHIDSFPEFFAPIFYILKYHNDDELLTILKSHHYTDYAMYVSVFGTSPSFNTKIPKSIVLVNKIINDVEIGNEAYGGYGTKSNFVYKEGIYYTRPILISQEL